MRVRERITIDPAVCNGKPTVRGTRIAVQTVLEFLSAGEEREEILRQYPSLEPEDIEACLAFGANQKGFALVQESVKAYVQRLWSTHPSPEEVETAFGELVSWRDEYLEVLRLREEVERDSDSVRLRKDAIVLFEDAERELLTLRDEALTEETLSAFGSQIDE